MFTLRTPWLIIFPYGFYMPTYEMRITVYHVYPIRLFWGPAVGVDKEGSENF